MVLKYMRKNNNAAGSYHTFDDIVDLHNEANEIFKIPYDKRTAHQKVRLEEIMTIIQAENEKYEPPLHKLQEKQELPPLQQKEASNMNKLMDMMQMRFMEKAIDATGGGESFSIPEGIDYVQISGRIGSNKYKFIVTNIEEYNLALGVLQAYAKKMVMNMQ